MRVNLVAVQPDMRLEHYASEDAFRARIGELARRAVEGLDEAPTLVAFPEAIALPLAFAFAGVASSQTAAHAALAAVRRHPGRLARLAWRMRRVGPSLLFHATAERVHRAYAAAFADAARATGATIVAGSAFLPHVEREPARGTFVADGRVRNVAYVFGPEGSCIGRRAKRWPMPRERAAGIAAAADGDLLPVRTPVGLVGVAICLDAFHDRVIERLDGLGARVIVQPSANHAPWDRRWPADPALTEGEAWLRHGLRAQVQGRRHVRIGVNPMLVGDVLDLRPRGRSSIVVDAERLPGHAVEGWRGVAELAPAADREAFVRATFDLDCGRDG